MSDEAADKAAELAELDRQIVIRRTSLATGVPAELLSQAADEGQANAIAQSALAWKGKTAPPSQPTAAAPDYYSPSQIGREALAHLSPEQVNAAYRAGRLSGIGAPAPGPRRNGQRPAT